MAIIDKKGRLHGKLGKLNYRVLKNGLEVVSTLPKRVRQTRATKESGLEFGLASNTASIIRTAFESVTLLNDSGMTNRLTSTVLRSIKNSATKGRGERDLHDGDLSHLKDFQFNTNSPLTDVLPVTPQCLITEGKRLKVHLPVFQGADLKRMPYGTTCIMELVLIAFDFRKKYYETLDYTNIEIDRKQNNSISWEPEVEIPAGCIAILSMSLNYSSYSSNTNSYTHLNSKAFSPAAIVMATSIPEDQVSNVQEKRENAIEISDYLGSELLNKILELRLKDRKYQAELRGKQKPRPKPLPDVRPVLMKGKKYFK